jgi:membrane associated rhomboid family serine protease
MFIPVGDHPNPRGFPLVNWLLIAANFGIYFLVILPLSSQPADPRTPEALEYIELITRVTGEPALAVLRQLSAYDVYVYVHGYRPLAPQWLDLFYSMFLHAGLAHLLGNMLFLWIYGDNVEHRLGHVGYLLAYLATGLVATWTHSLVSPDPQFPVVGASGAISGVLGFYFVWFPRNLVKVFIALFPFWVDVVMLPARWVLGFYLLVDNLLPFLLQSQSGGVAHGAHIGGFVAGLCLAVLLRRFRQFQAVREFGGPGTDTAQDPATGLLAAAQAGRWRDAAHELLRLPRTEVARVPSRTWLDVARWLSNNAAPEVAATAYRRFVTQRPRDPDLAEAHLGLGLLHLQHGEATTAYQYLLEALDLDPPPEVRGQARSAIEAIEEMQRRKRRLS